MPSEQPIVSELTLKGPHARRRFTSHLKKVEKLLAEAASARDRLSPAHVLFQSGARTPMFMLEALGRVYEHFDLKNKLFSEIRQESKIVEDALGVMDYWNVVSRKCTDWNLPTTVIQLANDRCHQAAGRTWAWVESQDWLSCRYHPGAELLPERFARKLKEVEWYSPKKESRILRKWLCSALQDTHEAIQLLDFNDIENGLHKARREVRWISIYFTCIEGAFILDKTAKPPDNWERYLTKEIVENPYNKLPVPEPDDVPITISAPLLYALSYAIDRLGVIKDRAQWTETVIELFRLAGEKPAKPFASLLGESYLAHDDASRQGRELLEQVFIRDRLLLRMAESISP